MGLARGKLRRDEPAPHVVRLTIDDPAKRNALDHDVLDALAAVLPGLEARCLRLALMPETAPFRALRKPGRLMLPTPLARRVPYARVRTGAELNGVVSAVS